MSRRRDRAKILSFQKGGLVLWNKRLDRGRFQIYLPDAGDRAELDATQLAMLVGGIDFGRVKRPRYWQAKNREKSATGIDRREQA